MDLDHLRTFAAVARDGSFAAFARRVDADPSSVSRTIATLEKALGVRLFDRTTRRLRLTEAGRTYLEHVTPLIGDLDAAGEAARDVLADPSGVLRVTASVAFGERWLLPRIATFRSAHPRIAFDLHLSDDVVDVASGEVDLALRLGTHVEGAFVATRLFETRYRVVASPAYLDTHARPARPCDLEGHDCLVFPFAGFRSRWRLRSRDGCEEQATPRAVLTTSNALALRRAALDGMGIALLADWTVGADIEDGRLVDLFPDHEASAADFDTGAWLVRPSHAYVPKRLQLFMDHLRAG